MARRPLDAEDGARPRLAFAAGLLLGLGFWCHILAVIHLAALAALFVLVRPSAGRGASRAAALARSPSPSGWAIGYVPGWLWNLANDWESFQYLLPGEARADEAGAPASPPWPPASARSSG